MIGTQDFWSTSLITDETTQGFVPTERERALVSARSLFPQADHEAVLDVADWLLNEEEELEPEEVKTLQGSTFYPGSALSKSFDIQISDVNPDVIKPAFGQAPDVDSDLLAQHVSELHDHVGEEVLGDEPEEDFGSLVLLDAAGYDVDLGVSQEAGVTWRDIDNQRCLELELCFAGWHVTKFNPADFHPTQLDTEEEYEAAPVGTQVEPSGLSGFFWEKREGGWYATDEDVNYGLLDAAPRKVARWGKGEAFIEAVTKANAARSEALGRAIDRAFPPAVDTDLLAQHVSVLNDAVGTVEDDDEPEEDFGHLVLIHQEDLKGTSTRSIDYELGSELLGDEWGGEGDLWRIVKFDPAEFHPTQLDTEEEYEAAPVGTRAKSYYTWEKTEDGTWIALEAGGGYRPTNAQLAMDRDRPVVRWGGGA